MYTQCPECGTVFRVTAAVLRAAQAQVRCGVCDANFNALRFLTDDLEAGVAPAPGGTVAAGMSASAPPPQPQAPPETRLVAAQEVEPGHGLQPEPDPASEPPVEPQPGTAEDLGVAPDAAPEPVLVADEPGAAPRIAAEESDAASPTRFATEPQREPAYATRTTPSADEARVFEEMTASLDARPTASTTSTGEFNVLEPEDVAELLLERSEPGDPAGDENRELEFNVPAADWERIFVESDVATPRSALDLSLGPTAADPGDPGHETLLLEPEPEAADGALGARPLLEELPTSEPELVLNWIDDHDASVAPPVLEPTPEPAPEPTPVAGEAPPEDEFEVELDLGAALDAARGVATAAPEPADDPLARTDEYPLPDLSSPSRAPVAPAGAGRDADPDADVEVDVDLGAESTRAVAPAPGDEAEVPPAFDEDLPQGEHIVLGGDEPAAALISAEEFRPRHARPTLERPSAGAMAAAAVLALALAGQLVHHARESLIDTPIVGPPLAALYRGLGAPIEPRWNLAAYEVRQWGANSDSTPGTLRLRASIVNRADRAQPYPLLRVVLEDRFGGAIARREFRPAEYLPGHAVRATALGAGARADADLRLVDPGSEVVGFELDVCLERRGVMVCGTDPRPPGG